MVGNVADLNRIIDVRDHRNSRRWKQLDHAIHRSNIFPGRHHLKWSNAISKQRCESEALNILESDMDVRLKMAVGQRGSQHEGHCSESDRNDFVTFVIDQEELSALPKRGLFLAGQFIIAHSNRPPKE